MINVELVLEKTDLAQLAERAGAQLKRSGNGWRGACPLHRGDNPIAFSIFTGHDGMQRWHCFTGCNEGGDAIDFVRRWRGLPDDEQGFVEAATYLADLASLPLAEVMDGSEEEVRQMAEHRQERRQQQALLELATTYYVCCLQSDDGRPGLDYAHQRGWTAETIKAMRLGYADGGLLAHLRALDADLDLAMAAGLIYRRDDGTLTDAIPPRYLVYTHQIHRQVTTLSGRATFTDEQDKKSRNLHAPRQLYWALRPGSASGNLPLIVVEGQACAITVWQWHYDGVALGGTSIAEKDVKAIQARQATYLILDADAGQDNTARVADQIGPLTMVVEKLPVHDLNTWLQDGGTAEDLAKVLNTAHPWIALAIKRASQAPAYKLEEQIDHLVRLVAALPQSTRGRYVREICDQRRLSTRTDFRALIAAHNQDDDGNDGFEVVDGRLAHYGDPLCSFDARITHELTQYDGLNPPAVLYGVEGTLNSGEQLERIDVPAEDFDSMRWIGRHWGARPIVYTPPGRAYLLRRAIQEVSQADLQRERVHTFTGWAQIEGRRLYLTTSGGLGADGLDESVRVDLGINNLGRYALPNPPANLRPAIEASLGFLDLAPYRVTLPLWAAMYAAPLTPIRPLNAVLWVYGITQSGKSTLAHLALTHFGPTFIAGHEYKAPKDWTSTPTDLERAMFVTQDAPVVIDDYAPAHSGAHEARRLAKAAHYVVRCVGNRSSRGRANADLSERQQRPPRGLVIATAENPLVGQSIVGRMIYVPVDAGEIIQAQTSQETPLDAAQRQAMAGLYAQAMSGYIVWLARRWKQIEEELPSRIETASKAGRGLFPPGQSRLTDYYGLLTTAARLALEYAAEHRVLEPEATEALHEQLRVELVDLLRYQGERIASQSPVVKFWEAIGDLMAQDKVYFAPRQDGGTFTPPYDAERIGWYDDQRGHVYLLTKPALKQAKEYWSALDERFDTLADALRRELWQQGYVTERGMDHIEKKPYINQAAGRPRVLVLSARTLWEKAGVVPSPDGRRNLAGDDDGNDGAE